MGCWSCLKMTDSIVQESVELTQIYDLLYSLGITANYSGFFYTSYAVYLAARQPERLLLVTKWLYPDVAEHYRKSWKNVERDIRTVASLAWKEHRKNWKLLPAAHCCRGRVRLSLSQSFSNPSLSTASRKTNADKARLK